MVSQYGYHYCQQIQKDEEAMTQQIWETSHSQAIRECCGKEITSDTLKSKDNIKIGVEYIEWENGVYIHLVRDSNYFAILEHTCIYAPLYVRRQVRIVLSHYRIVNKNSSPSN
jgi:hypothetical protein